jgi:hypothetical protein
MAGILTVDTIQSDSSYASTLNVASKINFVSGMQIGGQDATFGGMRNRVINGAMVIDQRNNGGLANTNLSLTNQANYSVDRFSEWHNGGGNTSFQQSSTAPTGFNKSVVLTVVNTDTPTSADYYLMYHTIEGYNIADLMWGTAQALPVTVSFWVRSSVAGTYSICLRNSDGNMNYPITYTISSANTFEYKTITIPGPTSGTWNITNGIGISFWFCHGVGSTYADTSGAWTTKAYVVGATGTNTTFMSTAGNTIYYTGVQLEKGSAATAFEYRQYGQELALCQRYYQKSYPQSVSVGSAFTYSASGIQINGVLYSYYGISIQLKQTMRTSPTVTPYSHTGASGALSSDGGGTLTSQSGAAIQAINTTDNGFFVSLNNVSCYGMQFAYTVSAEL